MSLRDSLEARFDWCVAKATRMLHLPLKGVDQRKRETVDDDHPTALWPAFIISSPRSGSTLFRYLLDAHENLASPPESKFLAGLQDFVDYPQALPALASLGLSKAEVYRRLRSLVEGIFRDYARRVNKQRWVDKDPSYYRILPFLDELFEQKVLYLFLARHPLDCIASLDEAFHPTAWESKIPDLRSNFLAHGRGKYAWGKYWMDVYERIYIFSRMHPERSHTLKYEDLVSEPRETLRGVLDFLHEPYSPGLEKNAFRRLRSGGYQDWHIMKTWRVHRRSVGRWQKWPKTEAETLWELVEPIASKFGYQPPSLAEDSDVAVASASANG
jgi:hypothetical protein